jgi:hypothetical protein
MTGKKLCADVTSIEWVTISLKALGVEKYAVNLRPGRWHYLAVRAY